MPTNSLKGSACSPWILAQCGVPRSTMWCPWRRQQNLQNKISAISTTQWEAPKNALEFYTTMIELHDNLYCLGCPDTQRIRGNHQTPKEWQEGIKFFLWINRSRSLSYPKVSLKLEHLGCWSQNIWAQEQWKLQQNEVVLFPCGTRGYFYSPNF
jgi:hypothetical protein